MNNKFSNDEKIKNFDELATLFYNANFGQASKADIELLMFKFYLEHTNDANTNPDGTLNYKTCSDFNMSRELGITSQKIRNLKIRKQLRYPVTFDWKKSLSELMGSARYDDQSKKITINIPDPNLFLEIQNYIEEQNGFVELQINSKLMQIRIEYFLMLVITIETEESQKAIIKELKNKIKSANKSEKSFDEKNIGKTLIDLGADTMEIIGNIAGLISPDNFLGSALLQLLKITIR